MSLQPLPRAIVVKREHKEGQVKGFIQEFLVTSNASGARPTTLRLIARSMESPVARALHGVGTELAQAGIRLDLVLGSLESDGGGWLEADATPFALEIRHAANPRLLEAHEQLILDGTTVWIGDCMRRDPDKRDAFETYSTGHRDTAAYARVSFDRLWAISVPVALRQPAAESEDAAVAPETVAALAGLPEAPSGVLAATRH